MTFEEWLSDKHLGGMELEFSKGAFAAGAASRDAEVSAKDRLIAEQNRLNKERQEWALHTNSVISNLNNERDQLRAQINVLREAGVALLNDVGAANSMLGAISMRQAIAATPEQSLAEYASPLGNGGVD